MNKKVFNVFIADRSGIFESKLYISWVLPRIVESTAGQTLQLHPAVKNMVSWVARSTKFGSSWGKHPACENLHKVASLIGVHFADTWKQNFQLKFETFKNSKLKHFHMYILSFVVLRVVLRNKSAKKRNNTDNNNNNNSSTTKFPELNSFYQPGFFSPGQLAKGQGWNTSWQHAMSFNPIAVPRTCLMFSHHIIVYTLCINHRVFAAAFMSHGWARLLCGTNFRPIRWSEDQHRNTSGFEDWIGFGAQPEHQRGLLFFRGHIDLANPNLTHVCSAGPLCSPENPKQTHFCILWTGAFPTMEKPNK